MNSILKFAACESGATAIEYGLIAGLIGIGIITAVTNTGSTLSTSFSKINTSISTANAK